MTLDNSKRLYKHYVKEGMTKEAEDILSKHPEVKEKPKEEPKSKK